MSLVAVIARMKGKLLHCYQLSTITIKLKVCNFQNHHLEIEYLMNEEPPLQKITSNANFFVEQKFQRRISFEN
jgi:hypothetical protein